MGAYQVRLPRRRPNWREQVRLSVLDKEPLQGRCSEVYQNALIFGSNARPPRRSRPAIALRHDDGARLVVAPMTSRAERHFFKLATNDCVSARGQRPLTTESYCCPDIEIVHMKALLQPRCTLNEDARSRFHGWLRTSVSTRMLGASKAIATDYTNPARWGATNANRP